MKTLTFCGASGTVTGSCYVLSKDNKPSLMIDYGMYQGTKEIQKLNRLPINVNVAQLSGVLLTHAHLDHCGRLPLLVQNGFHNKIFMTEATYDLIQIVLRDAARIAESDIHVTPLYTEEDVEKLLGLVEIVDYNQPFTLDGFEITYFDAGHIIGAASILIRDPEASDGVRTMIFSGDLGSYPHNMLNDPHTFSDADMVLMESTYGGRLHPHEDARELLQKEINAVEKSGGTLLIPAFAIERTQELLYLMKQLKGSSKIRTQTPIFLDSPMGISVTDVYYKYAELFNGTFRNEIAHADPFDFPALHMLERQKEGRILDKVVGPKVIIAGSGMMSGGRILKHARQYLGRGSTRLLFVGYQGDETLGQEIEKGAREVTIADTTVHIAATISRIDSLSAHADEAQLLKWLKPIHNVKTLFFIHGEDTARDALEKKVYEQIGMSMTVKKPQLGDEILIS